MCPSVSKSVLQKELRASITEQIIKDWFNKERFINKAIIVKELSQCSTWPFTAIHDRVTGTRLTVRHIKL